MTSRTEGVAFWMVQCGITVGTILMGIVCLLVVAAGCDDSAEPNRLPSLEQTLRWQTPDTEWKVWGTGGDSFFGVTIKPSVVDVWQWSGNSLSKRLALGVEPGILSLGLLPDNSWVSSVYDRQDRRAYFHLGDLNTMKVVDRWLQPYDVCTEFGKLSRNGKYLSAWTEIDPRSKDYDHKVRFGLVASDGKSFEWTASVTKEFGESAPAMIRRLVPSDDGAYIGVAGWKNGVLLADVDKKTVRWIASWEYKPGMYAAKTTPWVQVPLDEVNTTDLAFTPDSRLVYAGGATGCVYGLKVETGEIVSKWWATPASKEETGYRISTISVSPDGRFVAAGTGPAGHVYLFSTKDGKRRIFNHGGSTILITSFSPDSKRLASVAAGEIRIWKLPEEAEQPAASAAESHVTTIPDTHPSK